MPTKKIKKKPGRKPKKKPYFGMEVQDAIVRYNSTDKPNEKNKIYQEEIHKAFDKLCENIINTFKFTYFDDPFEDVKQEVVSFLVMNMHKYDHTKGSKAFSYFSVVAKNYLILHNNANYKKYCSHSDITNLNSRQSNFISLSQNSEQSNEIKNFTEELIKYLEDNIQNIFKKKKDVDIAFALVELLKKRDGIENFNKKSLYILIREMTNVNTSSITSVVNTLKKHYKDVLNDYFTYGNIREKSLKNKFFTK